MAIENPGWGAPRIHGELRMLGFDVSERTVSRYLRRFRRRPQARQSWLTFLRNHRETIAAMDFFVVFSAEVARAVHTMGIKPVRTAFASPWQNPIAERFVGTCRRDLLDHVVILDERHLLRLFREYVGTYYLVDRTHLGLAKDTPAGRAIDSRPSPTAKVVALPRCGGLHHRYVWRDAA